MKTGTLVDTYGPISRAPRDNTPKLWRDMTPEEKGALILAAHEGKVIEIYKGIFGWLEKVADEFSNDFAYRVKPDDVRETVTLFWKRGDTGHDHEIGTIDIINGEPDPASIRMERI